jgi:hypothetical protein
VESLLGGLRIECPSHDWRDNEKRLEVGSQKNSIQEKKSGCSPESTLADQTTQFYTLIQTMCIHYPIAYPFSDCVRETWGASHEFSNVIAYDL